jgi:hypothetical protein
MRAWARAVVAGMFVAGCAHEAPRPVVAAAPPPVVVQAPKPEEPDSVQMAGGMGTLSDEEIAGPFQRRWDDITRCYVDATTRLNYLGGKIEVKLRVAASGDTKSAYVVSSTFGNWDAERCVLTIVRDLHFTKPHGAGPEAEFTYPIEFHHKRAVTTWDGERMAPTMARHKRDVSACKLKAGAAATPTLTMTVYVVPGGKVASAGLSADAPLDDAFGQCLVGKSRLWRFDDPLGKIAKATIGVGE